MQQIATYIFTILIGTFLFGCNSSSQTSNTQNFYVAVNGNDNNLGTQSEPFKTLERARDATRNAKNSNSGDIIVTIEV
jgi:hypothetical protein